MRRDLYTRRCSLAHSRLNGNCPLLLVCLGFCFEKMADQPVSPYGGGRWNCGPPKGVPHGAKSEFQAAAQKKSRDCKMSEVCDQKEVLCTRTFGIVCAQASQFVRSVLSVSICVTSCVLPASSQKVDRCSRCSRRYALEKTQAFCLEKKTFYFAAA